MAVFITGGYGHIGSWIAYLMAKEGKTVIVCDTGRQAPEHLAEVAGKIRFVEGDVMDFPRLVRVFSEQGEKIEGIVHTVGVMANFVLENPHRNVNLNVGGLVNVMEAARLFKIEKVIYTSTGGVYGAAEGIADESFPPNPADLYGATKISAEYIGRQYADAFGIDFRIGRLYFIYGPGRYPSRFIPLYRMAFGALEGLKGLRSEKGADQKLDFTHVEDAARGIVLLFDAKSLKHRLFNIATGKPHTVGEVAALARKYTHYPVEVEIGPGTLMPRCHALNIQRAKDELGFEPKYSLEEGIRSYADWMAGQIAR
jgi:nucleoside-diphosphate-sugar epimerase